MNLDDILSLAEAADELGLAQSTLRNQAVHGRLQARLVGKTWITTRQEVERYRRENLGNVGGPIGVVETSPRGHSKWSEIKRRKGVPDDEAPIEDEPKTDMSAVGDDGQVFGG